MRGGALAFTPSIRCAFLRRGPLGQPVAKKPRTDVFSFTATNEPFRIAQMALKANRQMQREQQAAESTKAEAARAAAAAAAAAEQGKQKQLEEQRRLLKEQEAKIKAKQSTALASVIKQQMLEVR